MRKWLVLAVTHGAALVVGIGLGIYLLPILTAPAAPSATDVTAAAGKAEFKGEFRRDLKGSDFLHWGEGTVSVSRGAITLMGRIAPGPDYKLYLSPEFVETEADFNRLKAKMARIGDVKTFENFIVPLPESIDPKAYTTVVVWCESFGQFITAARYR
ncbi:MAG: DM13 domain-containing protein [Burkholderiales bacterium]